MENKEVYQFVEGGAVETPGGRVTTRLMGPQAMTPSLLFGFPSVLLLGGAVVPWEGRGGARKAGEEERDRSCTVSSLVAKLGSVAWREADCGGEGERGAAEDAEAVVHEARCHNRAEEMLRKQGR